MSRLTFDTVLLTEVATSFTLNGLDTPVLEEVVTVKSATGSFDPSALAAAGLTPANVNWGKLEFGLAELFVESQLATAGLSGAARSSAMQGFNSVNGSAPLNAGYVAIDAAADNGDGAALLAQLTALGLQNGASAGAMAGGLLPLDAIDDIAALGLLRFARPAYVDFHTGSVANQADAGMRTDWLRGMSGLSGNGLTIGVISDSFNTSANAIKYAQDVASGDLPNDVNVLKDLAGGSDEGRAMAQLIHDVAPAAKIAFHTADTSQAGFAAGITALSAIAKVVVDDVRFLAEPMFEDGVIARAVDSAVATGDLYFSSAGNYAAKSYESAFRDSGQTIVTGGVTYKLHDFNPGAAVDTSQTIRLIGSPGNAAQFVLQWDDPFFSVNPGKGGAKSDLQLFLLTSAGAIALAPTITNNVGNDPVEILGVNSNGSLFTGALAIGVRADTPNPGVIKYVSLGGTVAIDEYNTRSGTNWGHSNAVGAISVGAADWFNTPAYNGGTAPFAETFTSKGGVPIYFDAQGNRLTTPELRGKTEITAPDGGNTTFFGSDTAQDADTLPNFYGTSAAAPNLAALSLLMLEKYPSATKAQILQAMQESAIDINRSKGTTATDDWPLASLGETTAGFTGTDAYTGPGLVRANEAMSALGRILAAAGNPQAINNAPVGIDVTRTVSDQEPYRIGLNELYTDADGDTATAVTITAITNPGSGTLSVNGTVLTVGSVVTGDAISRGQFTFEGANGAAGDYAFSFTVQDGRGATDTTPNTYTFNVSSNNDAPRATGLQGDSVAYTEEGPLVRIDVGSNFTLTDPDSADFAGGTLRLRISTGVQTTQDQLRLDPAVAEVTGSLAAGATISVSGTVVGTVRAGATTTDITIDLAVGATPASVQAVLRAVGYINTNAVNPVTAARTVEVTLVDGDGVANGGSDTLVITSTVTVIGINDAPSGTDRLITVNEDASRAFSAADFGFVDGDGNTLFAVKITTLPALGTLRLNGVPVTAGQNITTATIPQLTYTPAPNANSAPYTTFTFQVIDNGSEVAPNQDTDPNPKTITISVTPVDDAPVAVNDPNAATLRENETATLDVVANDTDIDNGPKTVATIDGVAIAEGGSVNLASGARVTLTAGNLVYNPNGAFNYLVSSAKKATNPTFYADQATDTFTYALANTPAITAGVRLDGGAISTTATVTYNAAATNTTYLESGATGNVSVITGFGVGDLIRVETADLYSFSSTGTTLVISLNRGGVISRIELQNTVQADALIFNEASAEAAVGFDFFQSAAATVSVTVTGVDGATDEQRGGTGNDSTTGTAAAETFNFSQGGNDTVDAGGGNDGIYFGGTFAAGDQVNGGPGAGDTLVLQGDYSAGLTITPTMLSNTEVVVAKPGSNYNIATTGDLVVEDGRMLTFYASDLGAGNSFTFNGAPATTQSVRVFGGAGADTISMGGGNDGVYFGPGKWNPLTDTANGGAGNDQIAFDGTYPSLVLDGTRIVNFETVVLIAGPAGSPSTFAVTVNADFVTGGERNIYGATLTTALSVNAAAVGPAGSVRLYGGSVGDTLIGGAGADWFLGGNGGDTLTGGGGVDVFVVDTAAQSNGTGYDTITDLVVGTDLIDVVRVYTAVAKVTTGSLEGSSFEADLAAAVGAQLGVNQGVLFTPSAGSFGAGAAFLVLDGNGIAGYQAGEDIVIRADGLAGATGAQTLALLI